MGPARRKGVNLEDEVDRSLPVAHARIQPDLNCTVPRVHDVN